MSQRRPTASGSDDPHMGGSGGRGVLLLAIAVVLGIVVLQATDQNQPPSASVRTETSEPDATSTSAPAGAPTTIRALRPPAQVKVLPANGTQTSGLGARVAEALKAVGYTNTLAAVDATTNSVEATIVQFNVDFGPEAQVVAAVLGLPATAVKPVTTPPVRDSRGADVIVLVGNDLNKTVTTAAGARATTSTTAR